MNYITKTLYLEFLACGKNTWLKLYKPELQSMFTLSEFELSLLAKGNLVEEWARKLFPDGTLIESAGEYAAQVTKVLVDKKTPVIFQATFIYDGFLVRNDVLAYDAINDCWDLHEVKGTNSMNEKEDGRDHVEDAAFQAVVVEDAGIKLGRIFIIHLNKEYARGDTINAAELFVCDDVTDKVHTRLVATRDNMQKAKLALTQTDEKALTCECLFAGRSSHCSTFNYSHPQVPPYSVHDLSRIGLSKKKLESLVESGIFDLNDVPEDFKLSDIQKNQVTVHKMKKSIIDPIAIRVELASLSFPLFFLDYESYPPAIPLFKGFKPYQQVPFQFSLDMIPTPGADLEHFEYLHEEASDPSLTIIKKLHDTIGPEGTIIVWHKPFERMINSQLAERNPDYADYLENINDRIYDLKDIFQKQFYVHPEFRGKTSIKNVLPVMVPSLTYKELEIQNGVEAIEAWYEMIYGSISQEEKMKISQNLRKYCGRDTYAMVAIWRELKSPATGMMPDPTF
ncbi:MAG: DUF2779 domain-containing protein [Patescibacteria group bacterium]